MIRFRRRAYLLPLTVLALILLVLPSSGQVKFRGRYLTGGGGTIPPILTVNIDILSFSTPQEISQLVKAFNEQGEAGFHQVFRSMKKGTLRITNERGMYIEFHSAREFPTDKGNKIELIAENTRFELGALQRPFSGLMFLVAILEIDAKGRGEAKIYEDATCKILPTGELVLDEHTRAPKLITGLTQIKN